MSSAAPIVDDSLDVVQHPTLGTLKFPKDMPFEERNASIERLKAAPSNKVPIGSKYGKSVDLKTGEGGIEAAQQQATRPIVDIGRKMHGEATGIYSRPEASIEKEEGFGNALTSPVPSEANAPASVKGLAHSGERIPMLAGALAALPGVPAVMEGATNALRSGARKVLLDPITKEPTVTPTAITKRLLRTPQEAKDIAYGQRGEDLMRRGEEQARLDAANAAKLKEVETARQQELADAEKLREQHAQSIVERGKQQGALDEEHAKRLGDIESSRQKQLEDAEKLKEQHATSLSNRGKQQSALERDQARKELVAAAQARREALQAGQTAPGPWKPGVNPSEEPVDELTQAVREGRASRIPARMPARVEPPAPVDELRQAIREGRASRIPTRMPRVAEPTTPTIIRPGEQPPVTNNPQDLISRTRPIVRPGEGPSANNLKRAGDFTQVPLQRLKDLARFGDKLAQNEINRRLRN